MRESTAAFGRGECFVERYLEHARHLETQCLADRNGRVAVLSTRDCSLQRRNQKLIEEAPAPFLTDEQIDRLYDGSKAILAEAGYVNAGTCEFLLAPDGTISFNEVNTRLQVEHPVTELVTGVDVVQEQLRIASGGLIDYEDPEIVGHAIEFRVNGEDPAADFLPSPGRLRRWRLPPGPVCAGTAPTRKVTNFPPSSTPCSASWSSTDETAPSAGLRPAGPGGVQKRRHRHRAADGPARRRSSRLRGRTVPRAHTLDRDRPGRQTSMLCHPSRPCRARDRTASRRRLTVEVDGRRVEVTLPRPSASRRSALSRRHRPDISGSAAVAPGGTSDAVTSPMQAKVVKVVVADGQRVARGETVIEVEAMKMEQSLRAPVTGGSRAWPSTSATRSSGAKSCAGDGRRSRGGQPVTQRPSGSDYHRLAAGRPRREAPAGLRRRPRRSPSSDSAPTER